MSQLGVQYAWGGGDAIWLDPGVAAEFTLGAVPANLWEVWQGLQGIGVDLVVQRAEGRRAVSAAPRGRCPALARFDRAPAGRRLEAAIFRQRRIGRDRRVLPPAQGVTTSVVRRSSSWPSLRFSQKS
mgnify:CR=1 FL=1